MSLTYYRKKRQPFSFSNLSAELCDLSEWGTLPAFSLMALVPLLPLFHEFNREYFDNALTINSRPILSIRWSDGRLRKTAGMYRCRKSFGMPQTSEIVLSRPLLEHLPQIAIESTLCHEMIHAWIDLVLNVAEGHGPNFHARMDTINAAQQRFKVTIYHKFPVPLELPRWWAVCPSCGLRIAYKRSTPGAACRKCCNKYHGGKWSATYLLNFEPVLQDI